MSTFETTGQKSPGTIEAQAENCNCEDEEKKQTPSGRPYCGECGRVLDGERPDGAPRLERLTYSALGAGR